MRRFVLFLIVAVCAYQLWLWVAPITHDRGVTSAQDPKQFNYTSKQPEISLKGFTLKPLALFDTEARVLSRLNYSGDPISELCPLDLALGWGPMSDSAVLDRLNISQSNRFFHWQYWGQPPIPEKDITRHATNAHIIPADTAVASKLSSIKKGSIVKLSGYLVDVSHPSMSTVWRSSVERTDSGAGACEIIYVKNLTIR